MYEKLLDIIRTDFISMIERIINSNRLYSEENRLSAIDTLALLNTKLSYYNMQIYETFHADKIILDEIVRLKKPFILEAQKEIAIEVSKIIESETTNATLKISEYMSRLKEKGIDLEEVGILSINQSYLTENVELTNGSENSFSLNKFFK
ncbi:MAG: hypothetical protein ACI33S_06040 [Bacilli bacterium]